MSNPAIRHLASLAALLASLVIAGSAHAGKIGARRYELRPSAPERVGPPTPLRLAYTFERRLPLKMRLDVTPALVIARDRPHLGTVMGYSGAVEVNAFREILKVTGRYRSRDLGAYDVSEWSVGVTLGTELTLPGKAIALHVLSRARSVLGRLL